MRAAPVLMYHKVGAPPLLSGKPDRFLNVSAPTFRVHLRVLRRLGYTPLTFQALLRGLAGAGPLPTRPCAITFDDAYACVYENALPALREYGWPATLFVVTGRCGGSNDWDDRAGHAPLPLMAWSEVDAAARAGWEAGGHTVNHADLARLDDGAAAAEICGCRDDILAKLGTRPRTFCYPYGRIGPQTARLVADAGFEGACTTATGVMQAGWNPFLCPRVKPAYSDRAAGLLYRLVVRPLLRAPAH